MPGRVCASGLRLDNIPGDILVTINDGSNCSIYLLKIKFLMDYSNLKTLRMPKLSLLRFVALGLVSLGLVVLFQLFLTLGVPVLTSSVQAKSIDVPYEPTPQVVVDAMLQLANVTANDVVYDLGSGDGRVVVTAAYKLGARGVGVELDPTLVEESRRNVQNLGVGDRVRIIQQDLFKTNLREATVVTLYLYPLVNLRLRPKLFKELKPGTRIVSHEHNMGNWKPDRTIWVRSPQRLHTLYYWVVPEKLPPFLR